ncbi:MAG: cell division protein FtsQ/DivIB [Chloroflexota bacterium]|nr:cell division protein FtsQ/DivIB [Chloroflexota bacterium]
MTTEPRIWRLHLLSLAIAGLATILLVWMLTSPVMKVRNITVHRAASSPPVVVSAEQIESFVGQFVGASVFRIDTAAIREELQEIPGVADALVDVSVDGHLTVTIAYDAPVANWIIGGQSYLVDADGQILAARYRPDLELTIEETAVREPAPGEHVNQPALLAAYQLQSNLPLLRVFPNRIQYAAGNLTVIDHSGRELRFGGIDRLEPKLVALQAVLERATRRGERIASVDLRPVDRPTYRTSNAPPLISTIGDSP